jgi:hypothetical protein
MVVNFSIQYLRVVQDGIEYSETPEIFIAGVIHLCCVGYYVDNGWTPCWTKCSLRENGISSSSEMLKLTPYTMWGKNPEVRKKEGGRWGVISERHN